jgi:MFS family permease
VLRVRGFRCYFLGLLVSNTGTWMQLVAQNWLVLTLTESTLAVGITVLAQFLPLLLFALPGGVLADRFPRRTILMWTHALMAVLAAVLAVLTLSGQVRVWQVDVLALLLGMVSAVDAPARQAFIGETVGPGELKAAAGLAMANWHASRVVGPTLAAALITTMGSGWVFAANAVSFVPAVAALAAIRPADLHTPPPDPAPRPGRLREGWHRVRGRPPLLRMIALLAVLGIFGDSAVAVLLPGFASSNFHAGAAGYGLMNSSAAAGAIIGALMLARSTVPGVAPRIRVFLRTALGFAACLLAAALAPQPWIFVLSLLLLGATGTAYYILGFTILNTSVPARLRGRITSMFTLATEGGAPISGPMIGWLGMQAGPRIALATCGAVCLTAATLLRLNERPSPESGPHRRQPFVDARRDQTPLPEQPAHDQIQETYVF